MVTDNKTLDKVYTAKNHEELMDAYKDWAGDYESDTVGRFGYVAHLVAAKALAEAMDDKSIRILDAGCGTGLVGEALHKMGYENIDALDYSAEMLEEAKAKGVYGKHMQADLSKPLDIRDNSYDAVICVGTLTYGHVDADAFGELVRITRPDGHVCFTVRDGAYQDYGYRNKMIELEKEKSWELRSMTDEDYLREEDVGCKLCSYRVLD